MYFIIKILIYKHIIYHGKIFFNTNNFFFIYIDANDGKMFMFFPFFSL